MTKKYEKLTLQELLQMAEKKGVPIAPNSRSLKETVIDSKNQVYRLEVIKELRAVDEFRWSRWAIGVAIASLIISILTLAK
jgi:hypothetical protein